MTKRVILGSLLALLFSSMLVGAFHIEPVNASNTVYIRADGSIDPPTAPIQRDGDIYTLTGNIYESIVVQRSNIVIDGNWHTVQGSGSGKGFDLTSISNVAIKNMEIKSFYYGIWLDSSSNYNSIFNNTITNSIYYGIKVSSSSYYNSIFNNTITNNGNGISLYEASYNRIYHNNFIDNENNVYTLYSGNTWDDGYPSGGNYWSDYIGVDLYSGPSQNETGSDGLGDTPYVIDAYNRDRYPLMKPYPWVPHDIGITSISTSKTVVGQGFSLHINVSMFNYGTNTETFNVTVYVNTTTIATFANITLTSRNSTTITFTWNTTGFAKGNYTISAYAEPVPGETDTEDNLFTGGLVKIGIPGDISGDTVVDSTDLGILGGAWGSFKGDLIYNPNADIDGDGVVDSSDLGIMGAHWGETE